MEEIKRVVGVGGRGKGQRAELSVITGKVR